MLFTNEDCQAIKDGLNAPYVGVSISTLGGVERNSLMFRVSLDAPETWDNKIFHNSRYMFFALNHKGELDQHNSSHHFRGKKFRKRTVASVAEAIKKINDYLKGVS